MLNAGLGRVGICLGLGLGLGLVIGLGLGMGRSLDLIIGTVEYDA